MSLFSGQDHSSTYASFRPVYPTELFTSIASMVPSNGLAWDVACGSGQATNGLAQYFDQVIGTDLAQSQLDHAVKRSDNILYVACSAEDAPDAIESKLPIKPQSVDLMTVAQALHWINTPVFFDNVKHFLRPGGVIAIISYNWPSFPESLALTSLLKKMAKVILGPYWAPQRQIVDNHYRDMEFPFEKVREDFETPYMTMDTMWTLEAMFGYIRSWSAYQTAIKELDGQDPIDQLKNEIVEAWGNVEQYRVVFPIYLLAGRA